MAKQKYELLPDKVVAANAETIKAIGHIATDTDIVDYVSIGRLRTLSTVSTAHKVTAHRKHRTSDVLISTDIIPTTAIR